MSEFFAQGKFLPLFLNSWFIVNYELKTIYDDK